jgi:glucose-6-phosphate dehydrogenase assembly protein OpcA
MAETTTTRGPGLDWRRVTAWRTAAESASEAPPNL